MPRSGAVACAAPRAAYAEQVGSYLQRRGSAGETPAGRGGSAPSSALAIARHGQASRRPAGGKPSGPATPKGRCGRLRDPAGRPTRRTRARDDHEVVSLSLSVRDQLDRNVIYSRILSEVPVRELRQLLVITSRQICPDFANVLLDDVPNCREASHPLD